MDELSTALWLFAAATTLLGAFVKGTVGFAMPMITMSLLGSVIPPEQALAALIVPTLATNIWQALRGGLTAAAGSALLHWRFIAMVMVFIAFSAQLVTLLPSSALYLILGVPVVVFSLAQLAGWTLRISQRHRRRAEIAIGGIAGVLGGLTGVWGPPTAIYLTALDTPKTEQMRVQGVVYGLGAAVLAAAHLRSGVLNPVTLPLSVAMVVPAAIGLWLGFLAHNRLDQALFRRLTLLVLVVAGANLIRRGLMP